MPACRRNLNSDITRGCSIKVLCNEEIICINRFDGRDCLGRRGSKQGDYFRTDERMEESFEKVNVSLVGRNLWMIYCKAPFDPEAVATTNNYYQGIDYFMMPSTRNIGFNIKINF